MQQHDIVVIGGGHNGLVTAFYLAKAGLRPLVLERRAAVGGAAVTDEIHPGFRCSTLAHAAGPLRPEIERHMRLERHGLQWIHPDPRVLALSADGRSLTLHQDPVASAEQIMRFSTSDARNYLEFHRALGRIGTLLASLVPVTPPSIDAPDAADLLLFLKTARRFRRLGRKDAYRLLRWVPMAVADLVAEFFETELLRAAIAARGIYGASCGPWSAGSAAALLLQAAAEAHSAGAATFARGGMGAVAQAMAAAAREAGVEIRTASEVARIDVHDGEAHGVTLSSGEEIKARAIVSNADPRRTFLGLLDPVHLDPDFISKIRNYRSAGVSAKVNLALSAFPRFSALAPAAGAGGNGQLALAGRIHIGPEIDYLEQAYDDSKYGRYSARPYLDVTIPSISDPSLASSGAHVMSVYMQFAPYTLREGDWHSRREALGDIVIDTLETYAPNLRRLIVARQVITPLDLERDYALTGGHIFHGEPALDQLFTMRPLLGWARYRTPIKGLYLCGAGTHPGGGVTGAPGANASREILKDLRARR